MASLILKYKDRKIEKAIHCSKVDLTFTESPKKIPFTLIGHKYIYLLTKNHELLELS
jgi:hypothetical protein